MLRILKSTQRVTSSANDKSNPKSKGRVDLSLSQDQQGNGVLTFEEYGNYGRLRWMTTMQVTREEVEGMLRAGQQWLDGQAETTLNQETEIRDVPVTSTEETTFELVNGNR